VAEVKAKIQETQGDDFPAASMNIIYQGKVGRPGGSRQQQQQKLQTQSVCLLRLRWTGPLPADRLLPACLA
jgi:hypothetical protein